MAGHTAYTIETGVDIPSRQHSRKVAKPKYPFNEMDVGDSFFVPSASMKQIAPHIRSATKRYGVKYTGRTMDDGVRVWRVE